MDDWLEGGCHCGAARFRARLVGGIASARRCDCSLCRMRGAVAVSAMRADFALTRGADRLTRYTFNTGVAEHWFCATCGVYTHHRRRSKPNEFGINLACLDGMSPFDLPEVAVMDGINHPADGAPPRIVGRLRYAAEG